MLPTGIAMTSICYAHHASEGLECNGLPTQIVLNAVSRHVWYGLASSGLTARVCVDLLLHYAQQALVCKGQLALAALAQLYLALKPASKADKRAERATDIRTHKSIPTL